MPSKTESNSAGSLPRNGLLLAVAAVMLGVVYAQSQAPTERQRDEGRNAPQQQAGAEAEPPTESASDDSVLAAEEALLEAELDQLDADEQGQVNTDVDEESVAPITLPDEVDEEQATAADDDAADEIFEPTERVSEDSSVSFPVDI